VKIPIICCLSIHTFFKLLCHLNSVAYQNLVTILTNGQQIFQFCVSAPYRLIGAPSKMQHSDLLIMFYRISCGTIRSFFFLLQLELSIFDLDRKRPAFVNNLRAHHPIFEQRYYLKFKERCANKCAYSGYQITLSQVHGFYSKLKFCMYLP
jgi:hypothetical protein